MRLSIVRSVLVEAQETRLAMVTRAGRFGPMLASLRAYLPSVVQAVDPVSLGALLGPEIHLPLTR